MSIHFKIFKMIWRSTPKLGDLMPYKGPKPAKPVRGRGRGIWRTPQRLDSQCFWRTEPLPVLDGGMGISP